MRSRKHILLSVESFSLRLLKMDVFQTMRLLVDTGKERKLRS